jgi:hypothetical protein
LTKPCATTACRDVLVGKLKKDIEWRKVAVQCYLLLTKQCATTACRDVLVGDLKKDISFAILYSSGARSL